MFTLIPSSVAPQAHDTHQQQFLTVVFPPPVYPC
jgi:hypothetical protein